jgi:hypothetical protein
MFIISLVLYLYVWRVRIKSHLKSFARKKNRTIHCTDWIRATSCFLILSHIHQSVWKPIGLTVLCLRLMVTTCFYTWYGNSGFRTTASSLIAAWSPLLLSHHAMNNLYATFERHRTFFKLRYAWKARTKGRESYLYFTFKLVKSLSMVVQNQIILVRQCAKFKCCY